MSASTGTIQRPLGQGSIFGAVALAAAVLLAVIAITWGAMNLAASKSVATPLAAPATLDKGSRSELAAPVAAPLPRPGSIIDRGGREVPIKALPYAEGKPGNLTPRSFVAQPPQVDHTNTGHYPVVNLTGHGARAS
jgi:hypothetical protein